MSVPCVRISGGGSVARRLEAEEVVPLVLLVPVQPESTEASLAASLFEIAPEAPQAPEFVLPIPDPVENEILIKPNERKNRKRVNCFKIVTLGKPSGIGEDNTFGLRGRGEQGASGKRRRNQRQKNKKKMDTERQTNTRTMGPKKDTKEA